MGTLDLQTQANFATILGDVGRAITVTPRVAGAADSLGETTYTLGTPQTVQAVVLDVGRRELRENPGIMQVGDKNIYTSGTTIINPTDQVLIDGVTYRVVRDVRPSEADPPIYAYANYLLRKIGG